MKNNKSLTVREMQLGDIELIANYWQEAEPNFLVSLGVDLDRRVTSNVLQKALTDQMNIPLHEKMSYTLIWELDGKQVGHSNINKIEFGEKAFIHFHLWQSENRRKGIRTPSDILNSYFEKNNNIDSIYRSIANTNNLPYIELTNHFIGLQNKSEYLFKYDGHPNEKGYEEIAKYIGRQLIEKNHMIKKD